ncbi:hypothetical protein FQA47_020749 [Oryzias melastigma]|uniref:Uncharacterized protein n=1 Tax=Oryzias melastigma TaxID=30732 RepID=A0A834CLW3_ORYME|nr:hypothetical protein FQA47_020749 [Oryzias melastigma]
MSCVKEIHIVHEQRVLIEMASKVIYRRLELAHHSNHITACSVIPSFPHRALHIMTDEQGWGSYERKFRVFGICPLFVCCGNPSKFWSGFPLSLKVQDHEEICPSFQLFFLIQKVFDEEFYIHHMHSWLHFLPVG